MVFGKVFSPGNYWKGYVDFNVQWKVFEWFWRGTGRVKESIERILLRLMINERC